MHASWTAYLELRTETKVCTHQHRINDVTQCNSNIVSAEGNVLYQHPPAVTTKNYWQNTQVTQEAQNLRKTEVGVSYTYVGIPGLWRHQAAFWLQLFLFSAGYLYGDKRKEEKLHSKEFHNLYCQNSHIKSGKMITKLTCNGEIGNMWNDFVEQPHLRHVIGIAI